MADEKYHRTFLREGTGDYRYHVPAGTGRHNVREPKWDPELTKQPTGTVPPSPESPYSRYYPPNYQPPRPQPDVVRPRYAALVMGRSGVEPTPISIYEKSDQRFSDVATAFERAYSVLCAPSAPYQPIVDLSGMVVAHYGEVMGPDLISIPIDGDFYDKIQDSYLDKTYVTDFSHGTYWYHKPGEPYKDGPIRILDSDGHGHPDIDRLPSNINVLARVAAEIPVYVRLPGVATPGWVSIGHSDWTKWVVLVMPDGEVLHAEILSLNVGSNGTAIPSWSPGDLISIARLGAAIAGAIGKRVLIQAARLGYRLLPGATKELLKRLEAKLLTLRSSMGIRTTGGRTPGGGVPPGGGPPRWRPPGGGGRAGGWELWGPGKKIAGEPDGAVLAARHREINAAMRLARRADVKEVFMGGAARERFQVPSGVDTFPDVVAQTHAGHWLLAEGKGAVKMPKAIKQFEAAHARIRGLGGQVLEQEVTVPPLKTQAPNVDGVESLRSLDGRDWGVDKLGYLVRTGERPWTPVTAGGVKIRVVEDL